MACESMSDAINAPPRDTLRAIRAMFPDGVTLSGKCNWRVLGQYAATQAYLCHVEGDVEGARDWSELGVEVYRRLKTRVEEYSDDYELDEMRLRANAIVFCGPQGSNPLLDPGIIESWFLASIPFSIAAVRRKAARFSSLADEDFPLLRCLKERIEVIAELVRRRTFDRTGELMEWVQIVDELP